MQRVHWMMLSGALLLCWIACIGARDLRAQNLTITTASPLPDAFVGIGYSQTFAASGPAGGRTWTVQSGTLPAGMSLSTAGVLSGTPTAAGESNFRIRVATASQSNEKNFRLTVFVPLIIQTTTPLPDAFQGAAYS